MEKIYALFLIFIALAVAAPAQADVPLDEEDPYFLLMGEADKAIKDEDYPTAVARLREALAVDSERPSNALLLSNLGMVYSRMGQDSLAIATLGRALELAPSMSVVLTNRGRIHLKLGHNAEAYSDFTQALRRDSLSADARYLHGLMSLYGGNAGIAEQDFKVLESVDPDGYNTQAGLGALYSLTARERQAIPYYKKLIELDPSAEYYSALAGCYLALGDLTEASETIAAGLAKYDKDPELYYYRAMLNRDRYRLDDAHDDAELALRYGASPVRVRALFTRTNGNNPGKKDKQQ